MFTMSGIEVLPFSVYLASMLNDGDCCLYRENVVGGH